MNERLQRKTAISIRGLTKCYPDSTVANSGIDLDVYEGEVLSILGPNGAGKTTLVRQITAELNPTSGSVKIKDVDPLLEPLKAKEIYGCYSPGGFALLAPNRAGASLFFRPPEGTNKK